MCCELVKRIKSVEHSLVCSNWTLWTWQGGVMSRVILPVSVEECRDQEENTLVYLGANLFSHTLTNVVLHSANFGSMDLSGCVGVVPAATEILYQVGQLYSVAEASKNETGGGEGVEVLVNEPYERDGERGQYTHKIYHLQSKVPTFVRMLAPEGALNIHEKAWNAYPYCRTGSLVTMSSRDAEGLVTLCRSSEVCTALKSSMCLLQNYGEVSYLQAEKRLNEYMKDDFLIKIETWHKSDLGTQENVHKLEPEVWKSVEAIYIDIADRSQVLPKDYKAEEDPANFKSVKTGRGPLGPNWKKDLGKQSDCPYMCAYKLVTVKFKWWGLQNKVENFIQKQEKRLFTNFHRQLFCWLDKWVDLTMEDIRRMEEETKRQLDEMREKDPVKGMSAADD
ncbi:Phosphatidylinositol transfer protein alpha isoform [Willisornis vidua]|uniref:Phosphatidylinositol transfer protein alpha isoform n=1 Tax=Willisornis vidua TaxID=1566151 RepID=A0ABQ9D7M0_9PASS|nr:Phosphatidylinositol transfer protein alpha isoform [Willisornis vidua]